METLMLFLAQIIFLCLIALTVRTHRIYGWWGAIRLLLSDMLLLLALVQCLEIFSLFVVPLLSSLSYTEAMAIQKYLLLSACLSAVFGLLIALGINEGKARLVYKIAGTPSKIH